MTHGPSRETVRCRLTAERQEALGRLSASRAGVDEIVSAADGANTDDEHDPEGSTIAFERAQLGALGEAARRRLAEVDAALERLSAGTYGRCDRCGQPIPDARLEARPTARTCVACAATGSAS